MNSKYKTLPKEKRKKILLMSDDLRGFSGVGVVSKAIVLGTIHRFDWVEIGALLNHPDKGKLIDMSDFVQKETGIQDASLKIYPYDSYGNQTLVRQIIEMEKPDAILPYTDPRSWVWLFRLENEIRQNIPILYYNVWDDVGGYPFYNFPYYSSCDLIMNISKQTLNIVDSVLEYDTEIISNDRSNDDVVSGDKTVLSYIPHGINNDEFKPVDPNDPEFVSFKKNFLKEKDYDFIILFNNRNIRRKMVGELIADFKCFCDIIGKEKAEKVCLILKTAPIDNNGTNLYAVHDGIAPETNVLFAPGKYDTKTLNYIYNLSDVTMGISSAEGFGLATAESLMAGTPIIATVIGGLQDQMRFEDEKGEWISFDKNHPTNSDMKYKKHGEWAYPVKTNSVVAGSVPTPYIYDSTPVGKEVIEGLIHFYKMPWIERKNLGQKGREWMLTNESMMNSTMMCDNFIHDMELVMNKWSPKQRYYLDKVKKENKKDRKAGIFNPVTNEWI